MHTCHGYKTASAEVPIVGNLSLSILTTRPRSAYGHKTASPEVPPEGAIPAARCFKQYAPHTLIHSEQPDSSRLAIT